LDPADSWAPDILELVAKAGQEYKDVAGLHVVYLPDEEMLDDEARTEFDPLRICVRRSLQDDAVNNVPKLRGTLAHELGHAVFHSGLPKSRKAPGDGKTAYLAAFKPIESEAWIFARAFLMPSWKLAEVSSALELSLRCRVTTRLAEIRYANASQPLLKRAEPAGLREALHKLRSAGSLPTYDPRVKAERDRHAAWARARHIQDENPLHVRRSDDPGTGYRVRWQDYGNALSPFGWFVSDGQVLAYYAVIR
jgi:hypothetical protein